MLNPEYVARHGFLTISRSRAEDHLVVAADVAGEDRLVVLGVGKRSGAGVMEGIRSRGGGVARPVDVVAAISGCAGEFVGRLAEAVEVVDGAAGTPAVLTTDHASVRDESGVDLQRQVVGVHIAQVIEILAIEADGELRKIGLRLGLVPYIWISIVTWVSPNETSLPDGTHVEKIGVPVAE